MKQHWLSDELEKCWSLPPDEMQLLNGRTDNSRLVFSLLLKFFQIEGYFPRDHGEVPDVAMKYLGTLLNVPPSTFKDYSFSDR